MSADLSPAPEGGVTPDQAIEEAAEGIRAATRRLSKAQLDYCAGRRAALTPKEAAQRAGYDSPKETGDLLEKEPDIRAVLEGGAVLLAARVHAIAVLFDPDAYSAWAEEQIAWVRGHKMEHVGHFLGTQFMERRAKAEASAAKAYEIARS